MSPETRRAMRNLVLCAIVLAIVVMLAWTIELLRSNPDQVAHIAQNLCIIIGLFVLGVITENVGRVGVDIAGIKANMGGGDKPGDGNA